MLKRKGGFMNNGIVEKKIFKFIFTTSIILMCLIVFYSVGCNTISHYSKSEDYDSYDGAEDYPIQISYTEYRRYVEEKLGNDASYLMETDDDIETSENMIEKLESLISNMQEKIEKYTTATNISKNSLFIEAKKSVDKLVGLDMTLAVSAQINDLTDVEDVVVNTEEGQLGFVQDDTDISESLDNLVTFGLDMEAEGRDFIFFQNPNKYADSIPYKDYSDKYYLEIADTFKEYGLDRYDYGEALAALGMTERDIFYNTDHHWKPSTGILADKLLCEYLNDNYGYDIDVSNFEADQYTTETYERIFLGSLGKKVSTVYTEPDDFVIYYPIYDTNLTVYNSYDDSIKSGTVSETLFNYELLKKKDLYNTGVYWFFSYGCQALIKVHNNSVNDGSHILLIGTSFATCMIPYLATVIEDLEVIDLRHFDGSIRSYINETNPDTVIVLTGLATMETASAENGAFDFR